MNAGASNFEPGYDASYARAWSAHHQDSSGYDDETAIYEEGATDPHGYEQEQQQHWEDCHQIIKAEPGFLTPVASLQAHFFGDPISALAYNETYQAIHLASAAKPMGTGRYNDHKASMLVTQSTEDGSLYSSVAGHPQAPTPVLTSIYDTMFGAAISSSSSSSATLNTVAARSAVPAHAYRPYFGASSPAIVADSKRLSYQMGIHTLLPLTDGYVASVSPAGIRLHAHGGFQAADRHVEGMIAGVVHPNSQATHMTVGGLATSAASGGADASATKTNSNSSNNQNHLLCLDIWQDMRTVASHNMDRYGNRNNHHKIAVTAMATSHTNGSLLAGCSDGQVRMLDSSLRPLATIKSHVGGVSAVAVSDDGTLIATAGHGIRPQRMNGSPVYSFPDPTILVYDIRYLGRGGIPHPFAGLRGGPKHVMFLPDIDGMSTSNRLLVASGQSGGGMQIIEPFQEACDNPASFMLPLLDRDTITATFMVEDKLALGTSSGMVLQYQLEGYRASQQTGTVRRGVFVPSMAAKQNSTANTATAEPHASKAKQSLAMPSFEPPASALGLGPELLQSIDPSTRFGADDRIKSIFSAYILTRDPTVSCIGDSSSKHSTSFGDLAVNPLVAPSRLNVAPQFLSKAPPSADFLKTVATSELEVDILDDHRPTQVSERTSNKRAPQPNGNKLMYTHKLFPLVYEESLNRTKKLGKKGRKDGSMDVNSEEIRIPDRYRLFLRQNNKTPSSFNHSAYNDTGFVPGWDYAATMPNAFVPPVLMLLYFMPELRHIVSSSLTSVADRLYDEKSLFPELGFVFARIDNIARFALLFPSTAGSKSIARVGAWAPTNFISCLSRLKEAEQLQILDGSPAAVDLPRRPEAFYRFLLYHVDKELLAGDSSLRLESMFGATFLSVNEFISGSDPPSQTSMRLMSIDLYYENFLGASRSPESPPTFGDVLQKTLFRETRLRAWSAGSKTYETIVQRKVMTNLPKMLSFSCACAGREAEQGLCLWRTVAGHGHFLPEWIEIELTASGAIIVRELMKNEQTGEESWREVRSSGSLPPSISAILRNIQSGSTICKQKYRLDIVLSVVRDDLDCNNPDLADVIGDGLFGHQVVHARVPKEHEFQVLEEQCQALERLLDSKSEQLPGSDDALRQRLQAAREQLAKRRESSSSDEWIAVNGFIVSKSNVDDARAFHVAFKEPSLVIFRAVNDDEPTNMLPPMDTSLVPASVMNTRSLSNGMPSPLSFNQQSAPLPGDILAFDAEFVSVGDEESVLTETGSKLVVREMRYAVARISIIHCRTRAILLDDYILPREAVVDYLTRFSGIVAKDLDPSLTPHHLISTRSAYLKLRYLMERGCIFLGHGLQMDFWTLNLTIPSNQIIDTVELYHKPAQRYVSLRFLTNFVLKRDMQQDVHDSVEDAMAAYQLHEAAMELKKRGEFDKLLDDLYEFGFKNDWKLGVDTVE